MFCGHRSGVTGVHLRQANPHFVVEMSSHPVTSCSKSELDDLVCSASGQGVVAVRPVVVGMLLTPRLLCAGFEELGVFGENKAHKTRREGVGDCLSGPHGAAGGGVEPLVILDPALLQAATRSCWSFPLQPVTSCIVIQRSYKRL